MNPDCADRIPVVSGAGGPTPLHLLQEDLPLLAREDQDRATAILTVPHTDGTREGCDLDAVAAVLPAPRALPPHETVQVSTDHVVPFVAP